VDDIYYHKKSVTYIICIGFRSENDVVNNFQMIGDSLYFYVNKKDISEPDSGILKINR